MKLSIKNEIKFNADEVIHTAVLSQLNELIVLLKSGDVIRYNIDSEKRELLFSIKKANYPSGDFKEGEDISIYTLDDIVVVVNNFKAHGFVHYPGKFEKLELWRDEYKVEHSDYPIALFKDENEISHLIYGEAWNHVQIMNLDTGRIVTATKSLIEESDEEYGVEYYRKNKDAPISPWPTPYDYFFGKLLMSPDKKHFLSAGWVWGSNDAYTVYNVDSFIQNVRISALPVGGWEHDNRATCWVNSETVAVTYSPLMECDEGATNETPNEIHFYKLSDNKIELTHKIKIGKLNIVSTSMIFSIELNAFFVYSKEIGIVLLSLEGELLFENKEVEIKSYSSKLNRFITITDQMVRVHEIQK